ncbi:MAG: AI-2E family transporter [Ignavibacteriaceae bacterium]|nr:AI-2E family transporter [Ignavibacteriaceae bacterium]
MIDKTTDQSQAVKFLVIAASFVVIVAGMKAAESIIVPFLLALFIAIIASPPYFWLQEKGIPKALSMLIVIFAFLFVISIIGLLIGTSINDFTSKLPLYETKLRSQMQGVIAWLTEAGILEKQINLNEMFNPSSVFKIVANTLNEVSGLFANGFLILLMIIFMLLEVSSLPLKLKKMFVDPETSIKRVNSISENINKYIAIKTAISIGTGLLVTIFLIIVGVDYPVLWGVLAFALNFIPTIGSIISLIPPLLLTIVQLGFGDAIIVLIGYLIINTIMGNILEPRLMGKGLGLSTLVVFISLIFWGWVLGPIGMLLSVPLTITIKIILDSSEETRWFAILLGPEKTE